ncbi:hypothetical protein [Paracoccus saliphilus]|uniref:Uncharacterized protein n=1 Tax=Paracoccus saliphilus TaxID=405559 RepID=A0ABY7SEG9_9RHOB|nr:hypothetical protein [Paracoccus saliphilus]WCR05450.1 hypothetical protein JHX88_15170 [Paracoccus saliphilus]
MDSFFLCSGLFDASKAGDVIFELSDINGIYLPMSGNAARKFDNLSCMRANLPRSSGKDGKQANRSAAEPGMPDQFFLGFGFVPIFKLVLNEGTGAVSVFFCFGFFSSLPRRLLPFAMSFS